MTPVLTGADRIEAWPKIGRAFRMGTPELLRVPTITRIYEALQREDFTRAREYFVYMHPIDLVMLQCLAEWAECWQMQLQRDAQPGAKEARAAAFATWRNTLPKELSLPAHDAELATIGLLETAQCEFSERIAGLLCVPKAVAERFDRFVADKSTVHATARLNEYVTHVRARHDLLVRWLWVLPGALAAKCGQAYATTALQESFAACSFHAPMMGLFESLAPDELAAFLAEHLRFHFSGPGRTGGVEIIEEPDRFRVVFDPCGSGGAARRAASVADAEIFGVWNEPAPGTWRGHHVPAYCSHCAINEVNFINRVGFPVWVTEFNPDPHKPCGWTVFKSKELIPAQYYDRLGFKKPV